MKIFRIVLTVLLFAISIISCRKDAIIPETDYYISHELIIRYTRDQILQEINASGQFPPTFSNFVLYGVDVYKITYNTVDVSGNTVQASGALIVPFTGSRLPVLSFQHGTIREEWEAPSNFLTSYYNFTAYIAAAGFIMALPDYLGYGSSKNLTHPYEHGASLATASRDMLRAVYEFGNAYSKFKSNGQLFLTGYSEGGYASMALLKLLEEEHRDEFSITAASLGAGAYNKTAFGEFIAAANEDLKFINSFLWVLDTYNTIYELNRHYSYYFNEPYASMIEAEGVFAEINKNPQELFTQAFREGILSGTDTEFLYTLAENNNYDWKPDTPLRLYHGTEDDYVPPFNSQTAYTAMNARGAQVEYYPLPGENHASAFGPYMLGTFFYFKGF
jgi:dipeptidyl aminopeptidase/acylaminoacyl peptidase